MISPFVFLDSWDDVRTTEISIKYRARSLKLEQVAFLRQKRRLSQSRMVKGVKMNNTTVVETHKYPISKWTRILFSNSVNRTICKESSRGDAKAINAGRLFAWLTPHKSRRPPLPGTIAEKFSKILDKKISDWYLR